MDTLSSQEKMFLETLNTMSGGDPEVQVSMHEVGATLGLDKTEAGQMAETLLMGGFAELKTLSGGIGITVPGLKELGAALPGGPPETLGSDPVLAGDALATVSVVLKDLKSEIPRGGLSCDRLDEVFTDIKTIEVQLLSPNPKTAVVREVFRSMGQAMDTASLSGFKTRLEDLVSGR